jgi:hypothetical protein
VPPGENPIAVNNNNNMIIIIDSSSSIDRNELFLGQLNRNHSNNILRYAHSRHDRKKTKE